LKFKVHLTLGQFPLIKYDRTLACQNATKRTNRVYESVILDGDGDHRVV